MNEPKVNAFVRVVDVENFVFFMWWFSDR